MIEVVFMDDRSNTLEKECNSSDLIINETTDYDQLDDLFVRNGLDSQAEEEVDTELIKAWETRQNGRLAGGAALGFREGEYILYGIAVEEEFRGLNLGKELLDKVLKEVRDRKGRALYLVARAPGFYRRMGFETVSDSEAPAFFECSGCHQYQITCFPEIMRILL
jgi:N-acetylglutamate synthase-like GNAT family acetyltransferase